MPSHVPVTVLMSDTATGPPAVAQPTSVAANPTRRAVRPVASDLSSVPITISLLLPDGSLFHGMLLTFGATMSTTSLRRRRRGSLLLVVREKRELGWDSDGELSARNDNCGGGPTPGRATAASCRTSSSAVIMSDLVDRAPSFSRPFVGNSRPRVLPSIEPST